MNAKFYVDKIFFFFFFLYRKTKIMLIINMLFAIKFGTHNFSRLFLKNIFLVDFNIYIYKFKKIKNKTYTFEVILVFNF